MADERYGNRSGGAAAALSDLERARRRAGTSGGPARGLHQAAVDTFRDAGALLRALRTYDADHPRVETFLARLAETIDAYFRMTDRLEVSLQARALVSEHGVVFETGRVGENPWFPLFSAGVRSLSFQRGVTRDELSSLFAIIGALVTEARAATEDDAVTLLWARSFEHIGFSAVDRLAAGAFVDARGDDGEALEQAMVRHRQRDLVAIEPPRRGAAPELEWLRARNLSVVKELPASARAVSYRLLEVTERDVALFAQSCRQDRTFVGRYFGALLGALTRRAHEADGQRVLERLRELCLELISRRELRKAHQMLVHLERAMSGIPGIADFLVSDGAARHLVTLMDEEPDSALEEDGLALLAALSSERAAAVLDAAVGAHRATLRTRIFDVAMGWGEAAQTAAERALADAGAAQAGLLRGFLADLRAASAEREASNDAPLPPTPSAPPAVGPSGKSRTRRREARPTDLPPFRGAPMQNVELPSPTATSYLLRPGRESREAASSNDTPPPSAGAGDIDALVADYVAEPSEPDRGE